MAGPLPGQERRPADSGATPGAADSLTSREWRLLARSRFVDGDRVGALAAWNRIGLPRIDTIRVEGPERTSDRVVRRRAALRTGALLTPASFVRAERRLELLPVAAATRLDYGPTGSGGARVRAAVVERPLLPSSVPAWAVILVGGAIRREASIGLAGPSGGGELWRATVRYEDHRPKGALEVSAPVPWILPGVVTLEVAWERQTFRVGADGPAADTVVEDGWSVRVEATDWAAGRLRWEAGAGLDRWAEGPTDGVLRAGVELRTLSDRLSLWARSLLAASLAGRADRRYVRGSAGAAWRSSPDRRGPTLHLRARGTTVSEGTPLSFWPGAGDGRARDGLLRAHPLLDDGIVTGPAFGRTLVHGGAEARWWFPLPRGLAAGPAVFVDLARPWQRAIAAEERLEVDGGVGLRVSVPGRAGVLRLDAAHGLRGGGWHLEAGMDAPWPTAARAVR